MKFRYVILLGTLSVSALVACGGNNSDSKSGGSGGKASGGSGGKASGGNGMQPSGGSGGSAVTTGGSGGSMTGGMGGQVVKPAVGLMDGLIGFWPFDDGTGTVVKDMSSKGNTGTVVEGLTISAPVHAGPIWVEGHKGKALQFDGVNDWVKVPRSDSIDSTGGSGSVTITAWLKLNQYGQATSNSSFNMILNRAEVGTSLEHFGLGVREGKPTSNIHFFFASAAEVVKVAGWSHLAMTYDGITESIYVDGVLGASMDVGWSIAADTTDVTIGGAQNTDVMKEFVDGAIDEVYLFNRALTSSEIGSIMNLK